jgi:carboxymethylenebutenolidase
MTASAGPTTGTEGVEVYDAVLAESVMISGHDGDEIEAYLARPLAAQPAAGVVVIHHMPGYDRAAKEIVRRFATMGYNSICPNLHYRAAPGASPDDAAAATRAAGGVPDDQLVGDVTGAATALRRLTTANGRVATIGFCSGGRQSVLAGLAAPVDAVIDCYGAFVTEPPPAEMRGMQPLGDRLADLKCPLLGLFGNEDVHPSPDAVADLERILSAHDKDFETHSYDNAGHGFFAVDRPSYRPEAAVDGWERISAFLDKHIAD